MKCIILFITSVWLCLFLWPNAEAQQRERRTQARGDQADNANSQDFVKEFDGTLFIKDNDEQSTKLPIEMRLQRNGERLSGVMICKKGLPQHGYITFPITGTIDSQRNFVLHRKATNGVYKGRFISDSEIHAILEHEDGVIEFQFLLKEKESSPSTESSGNIGKIANQLPEQARKLLDATYPGWELSELSEWALTCVEQKSTFHPSLIWGDFDGDKQKDYALRITYGGKNTAIALLRRGAGFKAYVLAADYKPEDFLNSTLFLAKKGGKYYDQEKKRGGFYQNDAISLAYCGSSAVSFVFRIDRFYRVFTSD